MRILIIEDDVKQCYLLQFQLEKEGYMADICSDGDDAEFFISQGYYDVILLDRMLPHKDGITILKELRARGLTTPVIFLTALGELEDKVTGLDNGADDYLVKPFEFGELLARIRCLMRRPRHMESSSRIKCGDVVYVREEKLLKCKNLSCTLSGKEGNMLELFLRNPNQTMARNRIITKVWGIDYEIEDGNLDNYIYFIRRRLENVKSNLKIATVRGVGYRLILEE